LKWARDIILAALKGGGPENFFNLVEEVFRNESRKAGASHPVMLDA